MLLAFLFGAYAQAACDPTESYDVIQDYYMSHEETNWINPSRFSDGVDLSFFLSTFEEEDENTGESITFFEKFESNFEGSSCMMLYIRYNCTGKGQISHQFRHCEDE